MFQIELIILSDVDFATKAQHPLILVVRPFFERYESLASSPDFRIAEEAEFENATHCGPVDTMLIET